MIRSLRRIVALAQKEALHVARDPRSLYLALGMPLVLLVLFGFGFVGEMIAGFREDLHGMRRDLLRTHQSTKGRDDT